MRKRLIYGLLVLNGLLALALFTVPADAARVATGGFNCCQSSGGSDFCCHSCCWFVHDCDADGDC
jgi:hypothetical protein